MIYWYLIQLLHNQWKIFKKYDIFKRKLVEYWICHKSVSFLIFEEYLWNQRHFTRSDYNIQKTDK